MFQERKLGKKLLSFVVAFAMILTAIPSMAITGYADETQSNTLTGLRFAKNGKSISKSSNVEIYFSLDNFDYEPYDSTAEVDITANDKNETLKIDNVTVENDEGLLYINLEDYPWSGTVKITRIKVDDLEAATNFSFTIIPSGIYDTSLVNEGTEFEKGSSFTLKFKLNAEDKATVDNTYVYLENPSSGNSYNIDATSVTYNSTSKIYTAKFKIPEDWEGDVYIRELNAGYRWLGCDGTDKEYLHKFTVKPTFSDIFTSANLTISGDVEADGKTFLLDDTNTSKYVEFIFEPIYNEDYTGEPLYELNVHISSTNFSETSYVSLNEDGTYTGGFSLNSQYESGTYVIDYLYYYNDEGDRIKVKPTNEASFIVKNEISDKDAPVVGDLYFELNGKKVAPGFRALASDQLKVYMEATDPNGLSEVCVELYTNSDVEGSNFVDLDLSEESQGLWSATIPVDTMSSAEWYIDAAYATDKYNNKTNCGTANGLSLSNMRFLVGEDAVMDTMEFNYCFQPKPYMSDEDPEPEYKYAETSRITSLREMGYTEMPSASIVPNAEHIGWSYDDAYPVITSVDDPIYLEYGDLYFRPVYDKVIVRVYASYIHATKGKTNETILLGAEDGTLAKDFESEVKKALANKNHKKACEFLSWNIYFDDPSGIITDAEDSSPIFYADADYHNPSGEKDLVKVTLKTKGGEITYSGKTYSTSLSLNVNINSKDHMANLPKPTKSGYVFAGWVDSDGWRVDNLSWTDTRTLYALWKSRKDPSPIDAHLYVESEECSDSTRIWSDVDDTYAEYTIPFDYKNPVAYINVTYPNGKTKRIDVTFDENKEFSTIVTCISEDGSATRNYRADVRIEPYPTKPYDMKVHFKDKYGYFDNKSFEFDENNTANVIFERDYGNFKTATIKGTDINGNQLRGRISFDENGFATWSFTSFNGETYTVNVQREPLSSDTKHDAYVFSNTEKGEAVAFADFYADLIDGEATIEAPYKSITDRDSSTYLIINPWYDDAVVSGDGIKYDGESEEYSKAIPYSATGKATVTYTITAEDGVTQKEYTIHLVEADGSNTSLQTLYAGINVKTTDGDEYLDYFALDVEQAQTPAGETFVIPYYSDSNYVKVMYETGDLLSIIGLENNKVTLNKNGYATVEFKVVSPNGKVTQPYKITFIKDKAGDSTNINKYVIDWYDEETDAFIEKYYNLSNADTPEGAIVGIEKDIVKNTSYSGYILAEDSSYIQYNITDPAGNVETYKERDYVYLYPDFEKGDTDVVEFKVISGDGKQSKDCKITFKLIDSCQHLNEGVLTGSDPTCDRAGKTDGTYCKDCGMITAKQEVIPAHGHDIDVIKFTKATTSKAGYRNEVCKTCGDVLWDQSIAKVSSTTLSTTSYTFNNYVKKPTVTVKDSTGKKLALYTDYTVKYATGRKNVGKYKVTITFKGNYSGTVTKYFTIKPQKISSASLSATSYTFNGYVKSPTVTAKNSAGKKLVKNTDYTVKYATGRKNVGKYKVTVTFKGNYTGTVTKYFKINPKGVAISKLTKGSKSFKVTWKKPTLKYRNQMTGYQIRYSTKSSMASAKTVTVKSKTATSKTIKKLKSKKKYYVQLRTYKTVNGVKYYSAWSSKKYVTTK